MRLSLKLIFVFCIFLNACKTTSSDTKDTSGASVELSAAIEATVLKCYGDVKSHPEVIR